MVVGCISSITSLISLHNKVLISSLVSSLQRATISSPKLFPVYCFSTLNSSTIPSNKNSIFTDKSYIFLGFNFLSSTVSSMIFSAPSISLAIILLFNLSKTSLKFIFFSFISSTSSVVIHLLYPKVRTYFFKLFASL